MMGKDKEKRAIRVRFVEDSKTIVSSVYHSKENLLMCHL